MGYVCRNGGLLGGPDDKPCERVARRVDVSLPFTCTLMHIARGSLDVELLFACGMATFASICTLGPGGLHVDRLDLILLKSTVIPRGGASVQDETGERVVSRQHERSCDAQAKPSHAGQ